MTWHISINHDYNFPTLRSAVLKHNFKGSILFSFGSTYCWSKFSNTIKFYFFNFTLNRHSFLMILYCYATLWQISFHMSSKVLASNKWPPTINKSEWLQSLTNILRTLKSEEIWITFGKNVSSQSVNHRDQAKLAKALSIRLPAHDRN